MGGDSDPLEEERAAAIDALRGLASGLLPWLALAALQIAGVYWLLAELS